MVRHRSLLGTALSTALTVAITATSAHAAPPKTGVPPVSTKGVADKTGKQKDKHLDKAPAKKPGKKGVPGKALPTDDDGGRSLAARKKEDGDQAMQGKRYAEALAAYDAAYAIRPDPALLYNRARAEEHAEHFPEALALFEQFAEEAPPELRAKVPKLDLLMETIRKRVAILDIQVDVDGSAVKLRDLSIGTSPLPAPLRVPTGPATIDISHEGYVPFRRELTLTGGTTTTVNATLLRVSPIVTPVALGAVAEPRTATPPPEPTDSKSLVSRWWFWTGIGVGVAGGVAVTAALLTERSASKGTIAPGQVTAGLVSF